MCSGEVVRRPPAVTNNGDREIVLRAPRLAGSIFEVEPAVSNGIRCVFNP